MLPKLFPHIAWQLPELHSQKIELTFDDGPDPESTPILLDLLARFDIQSTFFVTGSKAEQHPELIRLIVECGHIIGNHGFEHLDGWRSSTEEYIQNIQRSQEAFNSTLFRPPYGRITRNQYVYLRTKTNLSLKMWSLMPGDFDPTVSHTQLYERLIRHTRSRDIIALHDQPRAVENLVKILDNYMDWLESKDLSALSLFARSKA